MKALIRNEGETITEDMGISGIDWETGMPLTSPYWADGPYTLVNDYVPPADDSEATYTVVRDEPDDGTIVIDGVTYVKSV